MGSTPTRAVAYLRVSHEEQAQSGLSLRAQRDKVTQYAALYDIHLVDVITDAGVSAAPLRGFAPSSAAARVSLHDLARRKRPGLWRVLDYLERGAANAVLVAKLDRLTRSLADLNELVGCYFAHGEHALLSVSEQFDTRTASGRLVINLIVTVAQWEREAIAERTKAALAVKRQRGEYTGGAPPYGFAVGQGGKVLVPVPAEQAAVQRARALRAQGLSLRAIASQLAAEGITPRSGGRWHAKTVQCLLDAPC